MGGRALVHYDGKGQVRRTGLDDGQPDPALGVGGLLRAAERLVDEGNQCGALGVAGERLRQVKFGPGQPVLAKVPVRIDQPDSGCQLLQVAEISKYPPAKPGALVCEPLKAA